jgi:hypothetical protein
MFRSRSFWDELLGIIESPLYIEYSYKERADVYRARLSSGGQERLRTAAGLLAYSTFERQLRDGRVSQVDLYVRR